MDDKILRSKGRRFYTSVIEAAIKKAKKWLNSAVNKTYFDDSMEQNAIVVPILSQRVKVLARLWSVIPVQFKGDRTNARLEEHAFLSHGRMYTQDQYREG